ncbi:MAG TPA: PIG-L family deacetylase [Thermoanaerobaculia bacterium]|nr:PIG-L family deacetylase [Thermoanaerobaculia bacterium]
MVFTGFITLLTMFLFSPGRGHAQVQRYPLVAAAARHDRILIVAPHVDDEAIGAGGFAVDAIARGAEVYVVFLTAGDCNRFSARLMHKTFEPTASNYLDVGRIRIAEAKNAMRILGVREDHFFVLGYPDRGLRAMVDHPHGVVRSTGTRERSVPYAEAMSPGAPYSYDNLMKDMRRVLAIAKPTTVIAPVPFDMHPDHSAAAEITDSALAELPNDPARLGYLVHTSRMHTALVPRPARALLPPTRMRGFTWGTYPLTREVQRAKDALLRTYKSQRPYTYILRSNFVRTNELFFVYEPAVQVNVVPLPATSAATARIAIAR